jgi:ankyrin repeat protein
VEHFNADIMAIDYRG